MTSLRGSGEKSVSGKASHLPVNFVKHATLHVAPERCVPLSRHTAQASLMPYEGHGFIAVKFTTAFIAFTIHACCRLTLRVTSYQFMSCQPFVLWVGASVDDLPSAVGFGCANCFITAICFPTFDDLSSSLVIRDLLEVCPLSRGINLNPYPLDYRTAFAFFQHPLPAVLSAYLTAYFPWRQVA